MDTEYRVEADVEIFPQVDGWHYVPVPAEISEDLEGLAERGLIPITATTGDTTWQTSLLPKGDGTHFIALNAKVRKAESIEFGDRIAVRFRHRDR